MQSKQYKYSGTFTATTEDGFNWVHDYFYSQVFPMTIYDRYSLQIQVAKVDAGWGETMQGIITTYKSNDGVHWLVDDIQAPTIGYSEQLPEQPDRVAMRDKIDIAARFFKFVVDHQVGTATYNISLNLKGA